MDPCPAKGLYCWLNPHYGMVFKPVKIKKCPDDLIQ